MNHSRFVSPVLLGLLLAACGTEEVSSDEQARRSYLGLDSSIGKTLRLGFAGFNAAQSANIPAQSGTGDATGTLTVSGQVDQGAAANKGMRLRIGMTDYSDGTVDVGEEEDIQLTYGTVEDVASQPALDLSLRDIPTGTFTGTLKGTFAITGDLEGEVTLDLTMAGEIEPEGSDGDIRRKAGTTHVTGTATSGAGQYQVDLTL
jgi:hypothetical protein